ncbi:MAG: TraB/GumN family protein [Deltaproteobacteria bacterium]|nr:TraB/GumN family protein [Deltaproteobacteria bacterium]MBN2845780.1 TraB/GumN family protein [Deltaproteobacteria bacterium]
MTVENENVHRLTLKGKELILVGTAHVSKESADLVERTIEEEAPDTVCVELCKSRFDAIRQKANWEEMDVLKIIREKRTSLLLSQLIMASFQKKIAEKFGINPGEEMLRAIGKAEQKGAEVALVDRDIRTTMTRTWRTMRFSSKFRFFFELMLSLFVAEDITEEDIEELKKHDALELAMQTFGKKLPEVKATLIDERDRFMAHEISRAAGDKIVAVVGVGHVQGILEHLTDDVDIAAISEVPPKGKLGRIIAWGIPAVIIGIIVAGFFHSGSQASIDMIKWWIIVNGVLAGLGALVVMAHPITIVSSVIAAPLTSINPTIAAGWVAGLVEASLRKPQVKDFMALKDDIATVRGFWNNKITRILLVVVFVNLGSAIGTFVAIPLMMRVL